MHAPRGAPACSIKWTLTRRVHVCFRVVLCPPYVLVAPPGLVPGTSVNGLSLSPSLFASSTSPW